MRAQSSTTATSAARAVTAPKSRLMVLFFSDIVGSTELKNRLGTVEYAGLLARHGSIFRGLIATTSGGQILKDTGDGFFGSGAPLDGARQRVIMFPHARGTAPFNFRRAASAIA